MKLPFVLLLSSALAFLACSDDSSSTSAKDDAPSSSSAKAKSSSSAKAEAKYDCTTDDAVVVAYPAGGEKFKLGDTITVVYGAAPSLAGPLFIFRYRENDEDSGTELLDESAGEENPDGKTCYEQKVWLNPELLNASKEAFIQVIPYSKTSKMGKSGKFTVAE